MMKGGTAAEVLKSNLLFDFICIVHLGMYLNCNVGIVR